MIGTPVAIPGQYSMQISVMRYMGWSQGDYDSADAELVDEIEERLTATAHWQAERHKLDGD